MEEIKDTPPETRQKYPEKKADHYYDQIMRTITRNVIRIITALLAIILIYSVVEFLLIVVKGFIVYNGVFDLSPEPFNREKLFFTQLQGLISAALMLTILIELIQSLIEYLKIGNTNYVGIIIEIALIATVRHLLGLNLEHLDPGILLGLSSLIFVLGFFFLINTGKIKIFRSSKSTDHNK